MAIPALAAVAGAAVGAGGGMISGGLNYVYQKKLMRRAQEIWIEQMQNRYQLQAQDMEKAGLSKSLAYGQSPPGPSGGAGGGGGGQADLLGGALQTLRMRKELEKMQAETDYTKQLTHESGGRAATEEATRGLKMANLQRDADLKAEQEISARAGTYGTQAATHGQEMQNKINMFDALIGAQKGKAFRQLPQWGQDAAGYGNLIGSGLSGAAVMRTMLRRIRHW